MQEARRGRRSTLTSPLVALSRRAKRSGRRARGPADDAERELSRPDGIELRLTRHGLAKALPLVDLVRDQGCTSLADCARRLEHGGVDAALPAMPLAVARALAQDEGDSELRALLDGSQLAGLLAAGPLPRPLRAHLLLSGREEIERLLPQLEGAHLAGDLGLAVADGAALALPAGLRVGGSIGVSQGGFREDAGLLSCTIGKGVQVAGSLCLPRRANPLREVPADLIVGGDLCLGRCETLRRLPDGLRVGESLDLRGCSQLAILPQGLEVGRHLTLADCEALVELPRALLVPGNLDATGCTALAHLPDVQVGGDLELAGCSALAELRGDMQVGGRMDLSGCSALGALPASLELGGDLLLRGCVALEALPAGLRVRGSLDLRGCTALLQLPRDVRVDGSLDLSGCSRLEALPETLRVADSVDLSRCSALRTLPRSLSRVPGYLSLVECTSLEQLPEGLHVGGTLLLSGCVALASLPQDLQVGGKLGLRGCTALLALPESLRVRGDLDLEECSALEALPAAVLAATAAANGRTRTVRLANSGLSRESLDWLRAADIPGVRFEVALPAAPAAPAATAPRRRRGGFADAGQAVEFWAREASRAGPTADVERGLGTADRQTVAMFLGRLRDSKEFGVLETRRALAVRVMDVLELVRDEEFGGEVLQRMGDSLDACGDKPIWALNQMHLVMEVAKARGDAEALRDLGRRVMRLMVVHEHVGRKIASLTWVDDVCVYLRFEIELREALDLPVAATDMIYPSYVHVADREIQAAKADALAITEEQFEAWLAEWPEWQREQRRELAAQLDWEALPARRAQSLGRGVLARRLSRKPSRNLVGDALRDPVALSARGSVWSLADLLRHWERTGLDLNNVPVSCAAMRKGLCRA